jgi:hypothetical protein
MMNIVRLKQDTSPLVASSNAAYLLHKYLVEETAITAVTST